MLDLLENALIGDEKLEVEVVVVEGVVVEGGWYEVGETLPQCSSPPPPAIAPPHPEVAQRRSLRGLLALPGSSMESLVVEMEEWGI